jgi:hypothetical protein
MFQTEFCQPPFFFVLTLQTYKPFFIYANLFRVSRFVTPFLVMKSYIPLRLQEL